MSWSIDESFDLVEDRHVGGVGGVVPEHPARARRCRSAARSVSIVRICTGDVWVRSNVVPGCRRRTWSTNSVSNSPRAGWSVAHVQRLEVVPVGLDLGAFGDLETEPDEHVLEPLPGLGDEVRVSPLRRADELGEVEAFGLDPRVERFVPEQ